MASGIGTAPVSAAHVGKGRIVDHEHGGSALPVPAALRFFAIVRHESRGGIGNFDIIHHVRTVYIGTTIPSFYFDERRTPEAIAWQHITRLWWDRFRREYRLVTSSFVIDELEEAPRPKRDLALALMATIDTLALPAGLENVIAAYIDHRLVPHDAAGDAVHLAMASMHGIDFLLTWNIRHLANANKFRHLGIVNGRLGLSVPTITTPLNLIPEDAP